MISAIADTHTVIWYLYDDTFGDYHIFYFDFFNIFNPY